MKTIFNSISLYSLVFLCLAFPGTNTIAGSKNIAGPNQSAILSIDLLPEAPGTTPTLVLSKDNAPIWIAIRIDGAIDLDSYSFDVTFDSSLVKFIEAVPARPAALAPNLLESRGGIPLGFIGKLSTRNASHVSIAHALIGSDSTQSPSGSGFLALLQFQPLGKVGLAPFTLEQPQLLDWQLQLDTDLSLQGANLNLTTVTSLQGKPRFNSNHANTFALNFLRKNRDLLGRLPGNSGQPVLFP